MWDDWEPLIISPLLEKGLWPVGRVHFSRNAEGSKVHPWPPHLSKSHSEDSQICYQHRQFWAKRPRFHLSLWVFFKFDTNFGACKTTDDGIKIVLHMSRISEKAIRCLKEFIKQGAMIKPSVCGQPCFWTNWLCFHPLCWIKKQLLCLNQSCWITTVGYKSLGLQN